MENYYGNMLCYQLDYPLVDLHLIFEISSSQKSSSKTKLVNQRLQKSSADQQGLHSKRGLIKMYLCAVHALKGDHCITAGCRCAPLDTLPQKYSRLRCLLRVKGLVICFHLGWSGSTLLITKHIIKVGSQCGGSHH